VALQVSFAGKEKRISLGAYPDVGGTVRPGERRKAEWNEIDLEAGEWRIPAGFAAWHPPCSTSRDGIGMPPCANSRIRSETRFARPPIAIFGDALLPINDVSLHPQSRNGLSHRTGQICGVRRES